MHVVPDYLHYDGTKIMMTVAVSENEVLPDLDITNYKNIYKEMVIGDDIIILSFPQHNEYWERYRVLYGPWENAKSS